MKLLVVTMKYDYGDPARGLSGMDHYFIAPLQRIADSVILFDYMQVYQCLGKAGMNQELLGLVARERPTFALFVLFRDEFLPETVTQISRLTTTIAYSFDDAWRIDYSRFWSSRFTFATTSSFFGVKRWQERGCNNFLYSPFCVNTNIFRRETCDQLYDVGFVGQYHPYRAWILNTLRRAGIGVHVWGHGWQAGRLDIGEMIRVFNRCKINLNLSNNESFDARYIFSLRRSIRENVAVFKGIIRASLRRDSKTTEMVKGRHFELSACGAFQLSYYVEDLERYYNISKEIALYGSVEDMIEKIRYYLRHADEREDIAARGHERTLRDHTAEERFKGLFDLATERLRQNAQSSSTPSELHL